MAEIIDNKLITLVRFKGSDPPHIRVRIGDHSLSMHWPSREHLLTFIDAKHDDETDILVAAVLKEARTEDAGLGTKTGALRNVQFRLRTTITRMP